LRTIREARGNLELLSKLAGQIDARLAVRAALSGGPDTLSRGARVAVAGRLRALEAGS
jgi:hypothetical protein